MQLFDTYRGVERVKRGFSWPAFFFTWIWALGHALWFHAIGFLVLFTAVMAVADALERPHPAWAMFMRFLVLPMAIVFGAHGNRWRAADLRGRGYERVDEPSVERHG